MPDEDLPTCQAILKKREGALPYWRPLWEARTEERDFLDGDRYANDDYLYNRDRRRQQFRGQETSNVNRHKVAQAAAAKAELEARPVDKKTDPPDAEIAVSLMEWERGHPQKGYSRVRYEVIQDAIDCRAGAAMLDWDPDCGRWGETYWRWKDMNLLMWEPGFGDPHHLACTWLQEVRRMRLADVKRMGKLKGKAKWYVPEELRADGEQRSQRQGATNPDGSPRLDQGAGDTGIIGVPGAAVDDEHIWVLFHWQKDDYSTYKQVTDTGEIPPGDRYMACDSPLCTYRSATQDELVAQEKMAAGETLPSEMEPCPECGGHLSRRDITSTEDEVLVYPKGRKLVIMPLLQRLDDDEPFYEGPWPVPTARSFPIFYVTAYVRPGRPMGDSDTTRNWDAQIASDQLMTMAFERIMRHQNYYLLPQTGIYDYRGQRYEFRDDQFNVMYADTSDPSRVMPTVQLVQGAALDASWPGYWQAVQQVLLAHQGINDLGLTPESSKNIAVGTVQQLNQIGEIPIKDFIDRMLEDEGKAAGVHWDYLRYTYKGERLARLQIADEYVVDSLRGDELPNFDFLLSVSPPFSGLEEARSKAFEALLAIALDPQRVEFLDIFAEVNHYPPSIVRKVRKRLEELKARAQDAADAKAAAGGAGGAGASGAPPGPGEEMAALGPDEMSAAYANPFQLVSSSPSAPQPQLAGAA